MTALRSLTYNPGIFDARDIESAKRIILTTEGDLTTARRWEVETPYLVSLIDGALLLNADSIVLDYGCGIGRMSKALIEKYGCRVVGVDISANMRALAASYVGSDRFFVCAPEALEWLGLRFDAALTVWVLQHCYPVEQDIARIRSAMKPDGSLFVVNDRRRIVPTREVGWANDGKDVRALLGEPFDEVACNDLDPEAIGQMIAGVSYWATFRARPAN